MNRSFAALLVLGTMLGGCSMTPAYQRPAPLAPAQWPEGAAYPAAQAGQAGLPWRSLFADPRLQTVIDRALAGNQNLQATLANVAAARAQYAVQRAYQLPALTLDAGGSASKALQSGTTTQSYDANVGFSAFQIDLFGRMRALSRQAMETYLASQSGYRAARLTLVANVATAWVTLAADRDLLALAQATRDSAARTVALNESLFKAGLVGGSDVESARTTLEQARSDVASQTTLVAQDRNALDLLVGAPVDGALLPASLDSIDASIGLVPAGVSSDVLLRRPDVVEAEHTLMGTYQGVGAARAAFFPQITLTSAIGVASAALGDLFKAGAWAASASGSGAMPLLGGTVRGNLAYAQAQREAALASYRATVQGAFRDVANALARRGTITAQREAQDRLVAAARRSQALSDAQYRAGTGTWIAALVAQRTLYAAQQSRVATLLADLSNRITLYSALGADDTLERK